jgi:hypothetical protein
MRQTHTCEALLKGQVDGHPEGRPKGRLPIPRCLKFHLARSDLLRKSENSQHNQRSDVRLR